jgi:hypothetical protein
MNYFFPLLNVYRISEVRLVEIYTAELLVSDPSPPEAEIVIAKLKKQKSSGTDQILAEAIHARGKIYSLRYINSLIIFGIPNNGLISERGPLLYQFTRRAIKLTSNYC